MTLRMMIAIAALALHGCAEKRAAPETTGHALAFAPEPQGATVPITVRWSVAEVAEGETRIAARIKHLLAVPVEVELKLPAGVELLQGRATFTIAADGPKSVVEEYRIKGPIPAEDLVITAVSKGGDFGIHGKDVYRFGRAAPVIAPKADGPEIKMGNHNLGNAVPMDK